MATENCVRTVLFLENVNLFLRPLEEGDVEAGYRWINDPEVRRYLTNYLPTTLENERKFMRGDTRGTNEVVLAIVEKDKRRYIGNVGLHNINWRNRRAIFGFMIGEKDLQGKGYGTEAMETMLAYAFGTLNLAKVKSAVIGSNIRSTRCHEKCGFQQAGILKREFFIDGKWEDETIFELFAEEWFARGSNSKK